MAKIYPLDLNKNCRLDDVHVAKKLICIIITIT